MRTVLLPSVRLKRFGAWTRTEETTAYYRSRSRRRLGRAALALLGVALVLLSVGMVFADIRSVGDSVAATPKSDTLRLTIPDMKRVHNVPVYNAPAGNKGALRNGTLHLNDTGFPWQKEANVYIAGHRLGYPRTKSFFVFWDLNKLRPGDPVILKDAEGKKYVYRVFDRLVVGPNNTSVKESIAGKNMVSLQTCTLPNYSERLIVRAELVSG
jgi:sortase A